jgi:hypothetical protein
MCLVADRGIDCLHQILNRSYIRTIGPLKRRTSPHSSPKSRQSLGDLLFATVPRFHDRRRLPCYSYSSCSDCSGWILEYVGYMLDMFDSKSRLSWVSNISSHGDSLPITPSPWLCRTLGWRWPWRTMEERPANPGLAEWWEVGMR